MDLSTDAANWYTDMVNKCDGLRGELDASTGSLDHIPQHIRIAAIERAIQMTEDLCHNAPEVQTLHATASEVVTMAGNNLGEIKTLALAQMSERQQEVEKHNQAIQALQRIVGNDPTVQM